MGPVSAPYRGSLCVEDTADTTQRSSARGGALLEKFFHVPKIKWRRSQGPNGPPTMESGAVSQRSKEASDRDKRRGVSSCIRRKYPFHTGTYIGFKRLWSELFGIIPSLLIATPRSSSPRRFPAYTLTPHINPANNPA
ncbi:unnamed protein product [Arctogadus glacialis]